MNHPTHLDRLNRWESAAHMFGGAIAEIDAFRQRATILTLEGHPGRALDLIEACGELRQKYRRSARLVLADEDRQRLQGIAAGMGDGKRKDEPEAQR